ncbi:MAG: iron ABC transporter permease [Dorea sp.]|jgi:iron complex transport system permease protein|nr:iron ABC transporter permease [Dorea sp.]
MTESRRSRYAAVFTVMLLALFLMVLININTGTVNISVKEILEILTAGRKEGTGYHIIWQIRLPRILMAAILGGALSLSGFLLQVFFHNPIAGPFILGISSGAKMMVALVMICSAGSIGSMTSFALIGSAFGGSLISVSFVLLAAKRLRNMSALLVAGIMISYICSAVTDFIITFAEDSDIVSLRGWSMGSFSGMNWGNVKVAAVVVAVTFAFTFLMSKPIGAYQMGEAYARSMGVDIRIFRVILIVLSSVFSACVTAFAGPISFVGIAVPQLVKLALHTSKPLVVIPASFLGGAVFCMFCDLAARMAFAPLELNISTVTSVFGAPVVIWMLVHREKEKQ